MCLVNLTKVLYSSASVKVNPIMYIIFRLQEGAESVEVNPMTVFHEAISNAKPVLGTTKVTRGGKNYHVS